MVGRCTGRRGARFYAARWTYAGLSMYPTRQQELGAPWGHGFDYGSRGTLVRMQRGLPCVHCTGCGHHLGSQLEAWASQRSCSQTGSRCAGPINVRLLHHGESWSVRVTRPGLFSGVLSDRRRRSACRQDRLVSPYRHRAYDLEEAAGSPQGGHVVAPSWAGT